MLLQYHWLIISLPNRCGFKKFVVSTPNSKQTPGLKTWLHLLVWYGFLEMQISCSAKFTNNKKKSGYTHFLVSLTHLQVLWENSLETNIYSFSKTKAFSASPIELDTQCIENGGGFSAISWVSHVNWFHII